jgi:hypothetical protein
MKLNLWILMAVWALICISSASAGSRISADQIDSREGLVYEQGQPTPFTGIAYWQWPNGKVKTEREYLAGRPTGLIRTYSANGKLEKETHGKPPVVSKPTLSPSKPVPAAAPTSPVSTVVFQSREGSSGSSSFPSFPSSGPADPASLKSPGTLISRQGESIPIDLGAGPVITEQPKHGQLRVDGGGKYTYIPDPDYRGMDKFNVHPAPPGRPDGQLEIYVRTQPIDTETEILIVTDASRSMEQTYPALSYVRRNQLQRSLIRFYGSATLYEERVRILDDPSERMLNFLRPSFLGKGAGKKITLVFQDEAHPHYHRTDGIYPCDPGARYVNATPDPLDMFRWGLAAPLATMADTDTFMEDITALRQEMAASKGDFYRGVLFQINNPLIPGYRKFVETVFQGLSPYTNSRLNVKEYATGKFAVLKAVYGINPETSPQGYFDLIRQALGELGVAIPEA